MLYVSRGVYRCQSPPILPRAHVLYCFLKFLLRTFIPAPRTSNFPVLSPALCQWPSATSPLSRPYVVLFLFSTAPFHPYFFVALAHQDAGSIAVRRPPQRHGIYHAPVHQVRASLHADEAAPGHFAACIRKSKASRLDIDLHILLTAPVTQT